MAEERKHDVKKPTPKTKGKKGRTVDASAAEEEEETLSMAERIRRRHAKDPELPEEVRKLFGGNPCVDAIKTNATTRVLLDQLHDIERKCGKNSEEYEIALQIWVDKHKKEAKAKSGIFEDADDDQYGGRDLKGDYKELKRQSHGNSERNLSNTRTLFPRTKKAKWRTFGLKTSRQNREAAIER